MGNSVRVGFSIDTSDLKKFKDLLNSKQFQAVAYGGMKYAAQSTPTSVGQNISRYYGIKSGRVKQDVRGPFIKSIGNEIEAELFFARRPATGMQFKPRASGLRGVSFRFYKSSDTTVRGAFFRDVKNGRFAFKADKSKRERSKDGRSKPRYALKMIYGPSTGSMYLGNSTFGDEIRTAVNTRIEEQFKKGVERKYKSILRGYGFK